jgi:hypothetical protein
VILARPFDGALAPELERESLDRCRLWSRAALRHPVGYLERLRFRGRICEVELNYEYLDLRDDWATPPVELAPVPMLFSYAIEHRWPSARPGKILVDLGCRSRSGYYPRSDCGTYRAAAGTSSVSYSFDRMEPRAHWRGAGTLDERRLGEVIYKDMAEWGFNCVRPQIRPRIPAPRDYRDPGKIRWLTDMLRWSGENGLLCIVNWFTTQTMPQDRVKEFAEHWAAMARHCRDLPRDAICYNFINEPAGIRWDEYNSLMKYMTGVVRSVDGVHPISIEAGGGWAQPEDLDMLEPTGDDNTIYQFHFYGPHTGDCHRWDLWYPRYQADEERFRSYEGWEERMLSPVRFIIRHKAEVMHGEFGISFLGPDDAPRLWLEDVLAVHRKYRMHWNWWNYSGGEINRTGLVAGERENPLLETLVKYARTGVPE